MADIVVSVHFAFLVFVVGGGLLVAHWPRVAWLHVPAVIWGALVQFCDWPCPLTDLEFALRGSPADAGLVARLLLPVIYPDLIRPGVLTPSLRIGIGLFVVAINAAAYGYVFRKRRRAAT